MQVRSSLLKKWFFIFSYPVGAKEGPRHKSFYSGCAASSWTPPREWPSSEGALFCHHTLSRPTPHPFLARIDGLWAHVQNRPQMLKIGLGRKGRLHAARNQSATLSLSLVSMSLWRYDTVYQSANNYTHGIQHLLVLLPGAYKVGSLSNTRFSAK